MGTTGGGTLAGTVADQYRIVREKTTAEFTNAMNEARKASKAGDSKRAIEQAATAKLAADRGKAYFSQGEYDVMDKAVSDLNREISTAAEQQRVAEAQKQEKAAADKTATLQANLAAERAKRVDELLHRVRALQVERKYAEALEVTNNVLFLDPNNPTAELMRDVLKELQVFQKRDQIMQRNYNGQMQLRLDNLGATTPPLGIIDYPDDWPRISMTRTGAGGFFESPVNQRADASMSKSIPAVFDNVTLDRALAYISQSTGVAMDTDWKSLEAINVERSTPVSLNLGDQPAKIVLEKVLKQVSKDRFNKADSAINNGIVTIGSADTIRQQTVTVTYPISDMLLFAPDYSEVPKMDLEWAPRR
jgi:tetratricopeptide (TPR) repeat protein